MFICIPSDTNLKQLVNLPTGVCGILGFLFVITKHFGEVL